MDPASQYKQLIHSMVTDYESMAKQELMDKWSFVSETRLLAGDRLSPDAPEIVKLWMIYENYRKVCKELKRDPIQFTH